METFEDIAKALEWSGTVTGQPSGMGLDNGPRYSACPFCKALEADMAHKPHCPYTKARKAQGTLPKFVLCNIPPYLVLLGEVPSYWGPNGWGNLDNATAYEDIEGSDTPKCAGYWRKLKDVQGK